MKNENIPFLQEKLSVERTVLANQRTFLSFLRTSMYFLVAGLSVRSLLKLSDDNVWYIIFYVVSFLTFAAGMYTYMLHRKKLKRTRQRIGDLKEEYHEKG